MPGLELYYGAFMDLMGTRQVGGFGGIGPIGWDTIQYYCDTHGIRGEQAEDLHYHINHLDEFYMKHYAKKNSK